MVKAIVTMVKCRKEKGQAMESNISIIRWSTRENGEMINITEKEF